MSPQAKTLAVVWGATALAAIAFDACSPKTPLPIDRDGTGTDLGALCVTLRRVGCSDGYEMNGRTCYQRLAERSAVVDVPTECIDAGTLEEIRGCGDASTLRFRCP